MAKEDKAKVIMEAVEDQVTKSGDDAKIELTKALKPAPEEWGGQEVKPAKRGDREIANMRDEIEVLKMECDSLREQLKNPPKRTPKYQTEDSVELHLWRSLRDHDDNGKKTCRHCGNRKPLADFDPKSEYCKDCS